MAIVHRVLGTLGVAYRKSRDYENAVKAFRESLDHRICILGWRHRNTLEALSALTDCYKEMMDSPTDELRAEIREYVRDATNSLRRECGEYITDSKNVNIEACLNEVKALSEVLDQSSN